MQLFKSGLPRVRWLSFAAFVFDLSAVAGAWLVSFYIRFNGTPPSDYWSGALAAIMWVLPIHALMFRLFGLYRGMWVFASLPDLLRIAKAVVSGAILVISLGTMLQPVPAIPRSVFALMPILLFLVMGGSRAIYRASKEFYLYGGLIAQGKPVLLLGAGYAGASLARELSRSAQWRLVGLLDDDESKQGREIHGYKVLGRIVDLQSVATQQKIKHVIIAMPSAFRCRSVPPGPSTNFAGSLRW